MDLRAYSLSDCSFISNHLKTVQFSKSYVVTHHNAYNNILFAVLVIALLVNILLSVSHNHRLCNQRRRLS